MLVERIVAKYFLFRTSSCHTLPSFVVVFIVGVGRPRFLNSEEQKNDFLVYTIDGQSCKVLNLKYNEENKSHDLKDNGKITYELGGSPIISLNNKYLVGVLKSDGEACFLFDGVFGE